MLVVLSGIIIISSVGWFSVANGDDIGMTMFIWGLKVMSLDVDCFFFLDDLVSFFGEEKEGLLLLVII